MNLRFVAGGLITRYNISNTDVTHSRFANLCYALLVLLLL